MDETRPSWDSLSLFLIVAREGGLAAAARKTGKSSATIGRHMLALERSLGQELFIRLPDGYSLTAKAIELQGELLGIDDQLNEFYQRLGKPSKPTLKISVGSWTSYHLIRKIGRFKDLQQEFHWQLFSTEDNLSIIHREISIGIRNQRPVERGFAGQKIGRTEFAVYRRQNAPDRWIGTFRNTPSQLWLDMQAEVIDFQVSSPRNALDLALESAGKIVLPCFIGDNQSELERASDTIAELAHDRWLVTHDEDRHLPHIRQTIEIICDVFHDQS